MLNEDEIKLSQILIDLNFPIETQMVLMTGDISTIEELKSKDHDEFNQKVLDGEIEIYPSLNFGYNFSQLKLVANRKNRNMIWHSLWTMPFLLVFYVVFVSWWTDNWFHLLGLLLFPLSLITTGSGKGLRLARIFSVIFISLAVYFIYTGQYSLLNICGYYYLSCAIAANLRKVTRDVIRESVLESVIKLVYLYSMKYIIIIHSDGK